MVSTVTVMWILLANGSVFTQEYPTFDSCHAAQQVLTRYAEVARDTRFSAIMCIEHALVPSGPRP